MKSIFKRTLAAMMVVAMMVALAACGTAEPDAPSATGSSTATSTGVKVYRSTMAANPTNLNPFTTSIDTDSNVVARTIGNLLRRNPRILEYKYVGEFAEYPPDVSEDGLVWTFKLKEGLQWSDGTPINAHSYVYSAKMCIDPLLANRNASSYWNGPVIVNAQAYFLGDQAPERDLEIVTDFEEVGVKALDDYTLQYTLTQKTLPLTGIQYLGFFDLVHEELFEAGMNADRTSTTYGTGDLLAMPYCGPYILSEFVLDQWIAYDKNYDFVNAHLMLYERYEDRWTAGSTNTNLQLFEAGLIDYLGINTASYDKYKDDPRVLQFKAGNVWNFFMNTISETNPIMRDIDFRWALFLATDRTAIAKDIYKVYTPANFFFPLGVLLGDVLENNIYGYDDLPERKAILPYPETAGYNVEKAVELFNKAYAANGSQKITISIVTASTSESMVKVAEFAQETWESIFGTDKLEVIVDSQPTSTAMYDKIRSGQHDLGLGAWGWSSTNYWGSTVVYTSDYSDKLDTMYNAEFDELYYSTTKGDLLFDYDGKAKALARMEEILFEELPILPLFAVTSQGIYSDRIILLNREYIPGIGFVSGDVIPMEKGSNPGAYVAP